MQGLGLPSSLEPDAFECYVTETKAAVAQPGSALMDALNAKTQRQHSQRDSWESPADVPVSSVHFEPPYAIVVVNGFNIVRSSGKYWIWIA